MRNARRDTGRVQGSGHGKEHEQVAQHPARGAVWTESGQLGRWPSSVPSRPSEVVCG